MIFKGEKDCLRSFNISLDAVKSVMDELNLDGINIDNAVEMLYNKYAYTIDYTGKVKTQEQLRLDKWITI